MQNVNFVEKMKISFTYSTIGRLHFKDTNEDMISSLRQSVAIFGRSRLYSDIEGFENPAILFKSRQILRYYTEQDLISLHKTKSPQL